MVAASAGEEDQRGELRPNFDRLTVGVDLGNQWSHYCILGLEGETLAEGQLRTTPQDVTEFSARSGGSGYTLCTGAGSHLRLRVANPRLMAGSKRRKRKNDRIDANKLARVGRVDPQSLHPMQHPSPEDLGLVPKQEDSGESQLQLGISKAGDTMVRRLLVGSAQYILGAFGPDTDLRRYGLCERGGKNAKKRAAVAVARKLAVLLHRLWVTGELYEPLRHGRSERMTAHGGVAGQEQGEHAESERTIPSDCFRRQDQRADRS